MNIWKRNKMDMDKSSSFDISSETLDKSFCEYDDTSCEDIEKVVCLTESACSLNDIKNPVKKKINELAQLQIQSKMSMNTMKKIIPVLNDVPGASITIPKHKRFFENSTEKLFEPKFYTKCSSCNELNECPGQCKKCKRIIQKKENDYFIYLPIEPQMKMHLINHFKDICDYLDRSRNNELTDIDDGEVIKAICEQHQQKKVLPLTLNIDGGVIAEKTTRSLWPVQLYQNYLPPIKRFAPENILVVGLYYGECKPDPFELLFPLLFDLSRLYNDGIQMVVNGKVHDFLPMLTHCCCDSPARATVQNFKYATGTDACPICLHPGDRNKENGRIRIRYGKQKEESKLRNHIETVAHAKKTIHGVKGMSCLMTLPEFDIIRSVPIDYMHNVLLGSLKRLLSIWFGDLKVDTKFKPISKQNRNKLNSRLIALKPYYCIKYKPRSLDCRLQFRAIEFKYLLFYYLRYAAMNLIDKKYVDHFEKLSAAIYILTKTVVREDDLLLAEKMLNEFSDLFEEYFGISAVTMNIHLLRHLGQVVRNSGPLWSYSVFGFESNMGILSRYASGSSHVIDQIARKYIISISTIREDLTDYAPKFNINSQLPNEYDHILCEYDLDQNDGKAKQIMIKKTPYKSIHCNETKTIDYFFEMVDGTLGVAVFYVIKQTEIYVLFKIYRETKNNFHLREIQETKNYVIYPFKSIKQKLIYLKFATIEVVASEPNLCERT